MLKVNVLIIRTAGTNCDQETKIAFELLGAKVDLLHINEIMVNKSKIYHYQIIVFPGGFTYGDDIAAGKILANELRLGLREQLERFLHRNNLVLGICNGFQVLVKMGLLPGNKKWIQQASLTFNNSGRFEERWVYLRKPGDPAGRQARCIWTRRIDNIIYLPVAHGEGKFVPDNAQVLEHLKNNGQIVFQYCSQQGQDSDYPDNPNGSIDHIAGICDETGRIFGLMPHPERYVFRTQHPRWMRQRNVLMRPDGLKIFKNGIEFLKQA